MAQEIPVDKVAALKRLLLELGTESNINVSELSLKFLDLELEALEHQNELCDILLQRLASIDDQTTSDTGPPSSAESHLSLHRHTALLAMCLLISTFSAKPQLEYLNRIMIRLSQRKSIKTANGSYTASAKTADAANFHLSYLDQFVSWEGRKLINRAMEKLTERQVAAYPPIFDYRYAWHQMEDYNKVFDRLGAGEKKLPNVYMFMSVKGGVGKTSAALALATYLLRQQRKCGILDLDFSGPSLQFHLDIKDVSRELSLSDEGKNLTDAWVYPCFYDLFAHATGSSSGSESAARPILQGRSAPSVSVGERGAADDISYPTLVLPDSPTINSLLSQNWDSPKGREKLLLAIHNALEAFTRQGVNDVAIDMRPGLYGANGFFLRAISSRYPTRLILMGTPRLSDFATSVYECSWLSASNEFQWAGPTEYVINMWNRQRDPAIAPGMSILEGELDNWANVCVRTAIEGNSRSSLPKTSALHIHAQRIWPYFYYRASLPKSVNRKVNISVLRSSDQVRDLQDLSETSFGMDIERMTETAWYDELSVVFGRLTQ